MSDLISRSELEKVLKEDLKNESDFPVAVGIRKSLVRVQSQPVAYDKDKVVEQLEAEKFELDNCRYDVDLNSTIDDAIGIVKGGGISE